MKATESLKRMSRYWMWIMVPLVVFKSDIIEKFVIEELDY